MDLCADMLLANLPKTHPQFIAADACPPFHARFSRLPIALPRSFARNADRLINRMRDYPRVVKRSVDKFDCFHIVDHSYAHLVHSLPANRTGVYCHDLDTFRCILEPSQDRRPAWMRHIARKILTGLQKAAVVFHTTDTIRRQILDYRLLPAEKLVHAPNGVAAEFHSSLPSDAAPPSDGIPYLLHVGSCIPRKRVDFLLDVFRRVSPTRNLNLIQVGGAWTPSQQEIIQRHQIEDRVRQIRNLGRSELANLYRHASLVLLPSDAEGFGLPLVEALASGAIVVASDIPTLREVGGNATVFSPVGDLEAWVSTVESLLSDPNSAPPPELRRNWAGQFTWSRQAQTIGDAYLRIAEQT
ncbi:MAG: glycosyltransferase family 1 protein [Pirellula sp.]|nr:glycosyltransferase family 1 protein [Pirellula sp.]